MRPGLQWEVPWTFNNLFMIYKICMKEEKERGISVFEVNSQSRGLNKEFKIKLFS